MTSSRLLLGFIPAQASLRLTKGKSVRLSIDNRNARVQTGDLANGALRKDAPLGKDAYENQDRIVDFGILSGLRNDSGEDRGF
jgi:hypothetical protein